MDTAESRRAVGPDILRALAILLVMSWHFPQGDFPPLFMTVWGQFGWLGVDIFFVLSGYLIGTELMRPVRAGQAPDLRVFYIKRFFRIVPLFWIILAIYVFAPSLSEGTTMAPAWRFVTFTMNLGLDIRVARAFSHAWSLCVEEHFYLVLPVVVVLLRQARRWWLSLGLGVAMVAGGMVLRHALWLDWQAHDPDTVAVFMKQIYYPSYTRLDGLIMGVSLAAVRLFRPVLWLRYARPRYTLPLAVLCLGGALYINVRDGFVLTEVGSVVLYPMFCLGVTLLLATLLEAEAVLKPLRWTGLGSIAAISYSLYLCQKLVFHADERWLPKAWLQGWSGVAVYYVTAIAVAAVLYVVVERTCLRLRGVVLRRVLLETYGDIPRRG